jgi:hypothetical protein
MMDATTANTTNARLARAAMEYRSQLFGIAIEEATRRRYDQATAVPRQDPGAHSSFRVRERGAEPVERFPNCSCNDAVSSTLEVDAIPATTSNASRRAARRAIYAEVHGRGSNPYALRRRNLKPSPASTISRRSRK